MTRVWFHESDDSTLYRTLGEDEEYFRCDQKEIEQFVCVTKKDFEEAIGELPSQK